MAGSVHKLTQSYEHSVMARFYLYVLILVAFFAMPLSQVAAAPRQVLIIHSFGREYAPYRTVTATFRTELARQSDEPIEFHEASLEAARFSDGTMEDTFAEYLRALFAGRKLDLVVPFGAPAVRFIARYGERVAPAIPMLITAVDQRHLKDIQFGANSTIVSSSINLPRTIEHILQVLPRTTNVWMILGTSPLEKYWQTETEQTCRSFTNRIGFSFVNYLTLEQMRRRLSSLPPRTAILYLLLTVDAAGVPYEQDTAFKVLATSANAPIFGLFDTQLEHGIVGGPLMSLREIGEGSARIAVRMLGGESPAAIQTPVFSQSMSAYNWKELQRWKIPHSQLPPGSIVHFKPPSVWQQYQEYIIAALAIFLAQSFTIAGLLLQRARRRAAEDALRHGEDRMNLAAAAAHLGIWVWDLRTDKIWLSEECKRLLCYSSRAKINLASLRSRVHPDDLHLHGELVDHALENQKLHTLQHRILLPDGAVRWLAASARADHDAAGKVIRLLGIFIDITDRKQTEDAARQLSGRLITAQEDERKRIARDLHDDLNQRLALLSVEMELLGRDATEQNGAVRQRIEETSRRVKELSVEVHNLAYRLHPAKLDQLGLVAASRALCREFSVQFGVRIDFVVDHVPRDLHPNLALCLYRLLQESLQNAIRHSGAGEFRAEMKLIQGHIHFSVSDSGKGFDLDLAERNGGLGLISMRERIRQVCGTLAINSAPGKGTRIEVAVPLMLDPEKQAHNTSPGRLAPTASC